MKHTLISLMTLFIVCTTHGMFYNPEQLESTIKQEITNYLQTLNVSQCKSSRAMTAFIAIQTGKAFNDSKQLPTYCRVAQNPEKYPVLASKLTEIATTIMSQFTEEQCEKMNIPHSSSSEDFNDKPIPTKKLKKEIEKAFESISNTNLVKIDLTGRLILNPCFNELLLNPERFPLSAQAVLSPEKRDRLEELFNSELRTHIALNWLFDKPKTTQE